MALGQRKCVIHEIMSTYNPDPPNNGTWTKPSIHPCQRRHNDVQDSDSDYVDLLNTVQRHTNCSSNYCLRKKQNEADLRCRFKFPFEPCASTKLEFEPVQLAKAMEGFPFSRISCPMINNLDPKQFAVAGKSTSHALAFILHVILGPLMRVVA